MSIDPNTLLIIISLIGALALILLIIVVQMHFRLKKFLIHIDANNVADSLQQVASNIEALKNFQNKSENHLQNIEQRLQKSIRSVHTIRFNPFHGSGEGGNQSFATAFLNENGDGVVMSSIYTRDRVSVYSKAINNFTSEYGMSEEEKEALEKAEEKLNI
jgi:hypothetical protein